MQIELQVIIISVQSYIILSQHNRYVKKK